VAINDILTTARDALATQQYGLGVAGQNIANVNTPGYARRVALIETVALGSQNVGSVRVAGLQQIVDQAAERRFFSTTALASSAGQRNGDLASIEALLNDGQGAGLGSSLDAMFASFSTLASNPTDTTTRRAVIQSAQNFADRVSQTADGLAQFQLDALNQAKGVVSEINEKAASIAKLSGQIANAEAQGQDASDLKDQRTQLVTKLSELVDVHTFTGTNGQLVIQSSGTTLVEGGSSRTFSIGVAPGGAMQVLAARPGGGPPSEVTQFLTGGKLAGIRDARDIDAAAIITRLDQFAYDVATAVNAQHAGGYGLDGASGRNLFSVSGSPAGAARSLAVDATVAANPNFVAASSSAAGTPGDSGNAVLLSGLADVRVATAGTRTAAEAYSDLVGDVGLRKQTASQDADTRVSMAAQATQMRESASGVNLDEEMLSLTKFQTAYQAAAKVLSTADQLLADLIASVR
jgi:flagellar hook-associated protein 1 FlgK